MPDKIKGYQYQNSHHNHNKRVELYCYCDVIVLSVTIAAQPQLDSTLPSDILIFDHTCFTDVVVAGSSIPDPHVLRTPPRLDSSVVTVSLYNDDDTDSRICYIITLTLVKLLVFLQLVHNNVLQYQNQNSKDWH